ncbi:MAG: beta-propeller fold lactonase family protein [Bryobacteraceae bacterium]|jgi:YVTN family beta-propeller protein
MAWLTEVLGTVVFFALAGQFLEGQSARSGATGLLLVANKGDRTLGIIDPETGRTLAAVAEGGVTGHEVTASPDGKFAYVPIYGNSGVGMAGTDGRNLVVVDIASGKVTGNLDFGRGVRPHCPVFGPKDGLLYVTTELDNSITAIDPRTLKVAGTVPTGQTESHMLAITRDGRRGYTANVGPGSVSVLDLEARKTLAVIPISGKTQRISLSADDRMAFTADQTKPQLAVIDTATNKVKQWVALPGLGYGTAATGDGRYLLVAVPGANRVAVVDLRSMEVARSIEVPRAPQEVLISPDNRAAYVSCDASHQVAEIGLTDWKVKLIDAGSGADGLAWAPVK